MKFSVVVVGLLISITLNAQERVVFEAGGAKGWSMYPRIETDSIRCVPAGKLLQIAKGKTVSRGWFWLAPLHLNGANDYRIEARLRQTDGDIFNGFGVVYGYQDPDNYSCFMISSWKQVKLASADNGRWYDWRDMLQVKSIRSMGEWNTLVLEKRGNDVAVRVNDTLIISAPAPKVYGKGIGFLAHSTLAFEVEYLRVTEAPSGALASAPVLVSAESLPNATMRFHNILFARGKAEVRATTLGELNQVLGFLRSNAQVSVEIGGHTDNVGSNQTNQRLSEERAKAVMRYLVSKGISAARIKVIGYGESQPIDSNNTDKGREKNRRVEFKLLRETSN